MVCTLEGRTDAVDAVAVTPDGRRAVSASRDHTLRLWDLESGQTLRTLEGHTAYVLAVAVTPDGRRAVSASFDHALRLWDLNSGKTLHTLQGHTAAVDAVAVTADGRRAVSASRDHTLRLWDLERGKEIAAFTRRDWHGWLRYRFRRADDCWWRSIRSIAFPSIRPSRRNKACNRRYKDPAFKPRGASNGFVSCSGPSVSLNVG